MWKKYNKYAGGGGLGAGQTGRRSVCGEDGQDGGQLETELCRLQRQMHVMEGDRRAYNEESCNLLRKQQWNIASLRAESEEMGKILRLAKSEKNTGVDYRCSGNLLGLIEQLDHYYAQTRDEKRRVNELDADILSLQEQINEERKLMGCATEEDTEMSNTKHLRVTENRLDQNVIKFNKQLATNGRLREEIDHMRQDKAVFDAIHKRLSREHEETKAEVDKIIKQATQAYEERDEAQTKMMALKERGEKDGAQHDMEMKELQRIIKHDNKLKAFMGIKVHDRADLKDEEQAKKQKGKVSGDKDSDADKQTIQQLQEAISKIKESSGDTDINKIVTDFIKKEDQNFAMYNYVNELNDTVEDLQDEISSMQAEIKRFEDDDVKHEEARIQMLREMEVKSEKFTREAEGAAEENVKVCKVLDELRVGVAQLFKESGCDSSTICDMLGSEEGVTNKNILQYMGIIEQRTMELLQIQQYIQMKKEPPKQERKDSKSLPTTPVVQPATRTSPRVVQVAIVTPNTIDDDDLDDGELRPLTHDELKQMVMRNLNTKFIGTTRKKSSGKRNKAKSPSSAEPKQIL